MSEAFSGEINGPGDTPIEETSDQTERPGSGDLGGGSDNDFPVIDSAESTFGDCPAGDFGDE